jgi:hypothetical protein
MNRFASGTSMFKISSVQYEYRNTQISVPLFPSLISPLFHGVNVLSSNPFLHFACPKPTDFVKLCNKFTVKRLFYKTFSWEFRDIHYARVFGGI